MNEVPPRVRVTAPTRRRTVLRAPAGDLEGDTRLGGVYLASLMRTQLWLAARVLGLLLLVVGSVPLAFFLAPGLAGVEVLGIPLAWLLVGGVVYPVLLALAWVYVRRAERHERDFAELLLERER